MKKQLACFAILLFLGLASTFTFAQELLLKEDLEATLQISQDKDYSDFNSFLADIGSRSSNEMLQTITQLR